MAPPSRSLHQKFSGNSILSALRKLLIASPGFSTGQHLQDSILHSDWDWFHTVAKCCYQASCVTEAL